MTKESFNSLKKGDIISQNNQYYIVFEPIDEIFIDTQNLSDIGNKNEFGFIHSNINYKYAEIVTDKNVINAIQEWLNYDDCEPYSFILGYCKAKDELHKTISNAPSKQQ